MRSSRSTSSGAASSTGAAPLPGPRVPDSRWVTVNMDMTASIVAHDIPCLIETYDGFQIEFVFTGENARAAMRLADEWTSANDLQGPSRKLTVISRRIRVEMRRVREQYGKERVPISKEFRP